MSTSIETLVAEYTKTKEEFVEKSKNAMRTAFNEFFDANPDIDKITWTQYTPYFNDGDPCVFGVQEMYFTLDKDEVDINELDYQDEEYRCYSDFFWDDNGKRFDPVAEYRAEFKKFTQQIGKLPDEIFLNTFGDHVRVIASRSGFDVQEYEHD